MWCASNNQVRVRLRAAATCFVWLLPLVRNLFCSVLPLIILFLGIDGISVGLIVTLVVVLSALVLLAAYLLRDYL